MGSYVLKRKTGILNTMNGTIVGYLIYTGDGLIKGANGSYFRLPSNFPELATANSWEFKVNVLNVQQGGAGNCIICKENYRIASMALQVEEFLGVYLSSTGSSWDIANKVNVNVPWRTGANFYFKLGYDGNQYYLDYNEDGSDNYKRSWSLVSNKKVNSQSFLTLMGTDYINYWLNATMDLTKCSLTINGKIIWSGVKQLPIIKSYVLKSGAVMEIKQ